MVVLVCRCGGTGAFIYLCFLLRPVGFCFSKILHLCHLGVTKSACPTVAEKCLSTAICPYSRWRSQPLSRVGRKQRYNTLDFPTENRVPTGMLLAPIGNPEPKRLRPSGHPACPCSDYPSCSHTMDAPLPEQAKQAQRFARIAGRFLCLYLFSGGWTEPTKKPCRTLGLG